MLSNRLNPTYSLCHRVLIAGALKKTKHLYFAIYTYEVYKD